MNSIEVKMGLAKIFHRIAPEIDFNALDLTRPLRDQIEMDSLDFYRVLVQVDRQLGVFVPDSKLAQFQNLDELIKFISEQPIRHQPQSPDL